VAKKMGKSEKLDLVLAELSALRADIKTLLKLGVVRGGASGKARGAPAPAKKKATKRARTPTKAPTKPVLVEAAERDAPTPNLTSRIAEARPGAR
jgi:hypothetical protein